MKQQVVETPFIIGNLRPKKKSNLPAFIFLGVIAILGIVLAVSLVFFDIDNKVDVSNYPGSEKAMLTSKGVSFVEDKYTGDKPTSDYYKVRLTADSCEAVMKFYRTDAVNHGWTAENQDKTSAGKVLVDSYGKDPKGLFVYCAPASEQLIQNDGGKNSIIIATSDTVLKISI